MELFPFSYAYAYAYVYAYVTLVHTYFSYFSYAFVYACAYAYVKVWTSPYQLLVNGYRCLLTPYLVTLFILVNKQNTVLGNLIWLQSALILQMLFVQFLFNGNQPFLVVLFRWSPDEERASSYLKNIWNLTHG